MTYFLKCLSCPKDLCQKKKYLLLKEKLHQLKVHQPSDKFENTAFCMSLCIPKSSNLPILNWLLDPAFFHNTVKDSQITKKKGISLPKQKSNKLLPGDKGIEVSMLI